MITKICRSFFQISKQGRSQNLTRQVNGRRVYLWGQSYQFSTTTSQNETKIRQLLDQLKDEQGKTLKETNQLQSIVVDDDKKMLTIYLNLTKDHRQVKKLISEKMKDLNLGYAFSIQLAPVEKQTKVHQSTKKGLQKVKNIIAVSSCKGGVGKSTVAVNLAFMMHKLGHKVGLADADIYGPSLPTMISPNDSQLYSDHEDPQLITPVEFGGIPTISYGFAAKDKAAIMRGPMVSNLVSQLVGNTKWGELEYLIIDFPPGTGDIQLTLGQECELTAAVIVTTPQRLSFVDVVKGIELFDNLKVPTVAVVENMSYYICKNCSTHHKIFGMGYTKMLKESFGIKSSFEIPIMEEISVLSDNGTPFVLSLPDHLEINQVYQQIAESVISEVSNLKTKGKVEVGYDVNKLSVVLKQGDKVKNLDPYEMRLKCQCASCIDEMSGVKLFKPEQIKKDVYPTNMQAKGNYAVAVVWSDGHRSSIYPYERLFSSEFQDKRSDK